MAGRQIWEWNGEETSPAFEAFTIYRDMGTDRTLAKVAKGLGKSGTLIEGWSARWNWDARVKAFDAHLDAIGIKARESEIIAMNKKHIKIGETMQAKALQRLQRLNIDDMDANEIRQFLDTAIKIERQARGESTDRLDIQQNINMAVIKVNGNEIDGD